MGGSASPVRIAPRRFIFSLRGGGGQAGSCECVSASLSQHTQSLVLYINPPPSCPYCPVRAGRAASVRTVCPPLVWRLMPSVILSIAGLVVAYSRARLMIV